MDRQSEHRIHRIGWLRAAVLGANDGIVSTASLVIGIASAGASSTNILLAGVAGLVAGAMSMAAGEYVSVSSQADTERADLELEKLHLHLDYEYEVKELTSIYVHRGLEKDLARKVAINLMEHDALGTHAREELGITDTSAPKPFQAAVTSAFMFAVGALLPLLVVMLAPSTHLTLSIAATSLVFLGGLGWASAHAGGAPVLPAIGRVISWGIAAMAITALVGAAFDQAVF